jgi:acyl carrier protein
MEPDQLEQMREFICSKMIKRAGGQIDVDTKLVSSGLVDSMALVEALLKLEEITRKRIPAGKVQPQDMDTIRLMFATADRVGKPRR